MILLDTNVLIDGFDHSAPLNGWASGLIRSGLLGDGVAVNPVILAELCVGDLVPETVSERLEALGIVILDLPAVASLRCSHAYAAYLRNRRKQDTPEAPKIPLPDFFIGAHASILDLPLATSDVSRYQTYFPEIKLLSPAGSHPPEPPDPRAR
ncbi:type II toxin-antitoxin system VapC family toxin [Akkermansiaceae bacterium]|nr:type II toxin-antitoxin system VapC family toxin [Akkermansiaceae bacterium]